MSKTAKATKSTKPIQAREKLAKFGSKARSKIKDKMAWKSSRIDWGKIHRQANIAKARQFVRENRFYTGFGILLVVMVFIASWIWGAQPGSLWFFPKLVVENQAFARLTNTEATAEYWQDRFQDRASSYLDLASRNECVQLVLADKELQQKAQKLYMHLRTHNLPKTTYLQSLQTYSREWQLLSEEVTSCGTTVLAKELHLLAEIELAELGVTTEFGGEYKQQLTDTFAELQSQLRSLQFEDQSQLNEVTALLSMSKSLVEAEQVNLLKLYQADLAMQNVEDIFFEIALPAEPVAEGEEVVETIRTIHNYERLNFALCQLNASLSGCNQDALVSTWNSVNQQISAVTALQQGEYIFSEFFTEGSVVSSVTLRDRLTTVSYLAVSPRLLKYPLYSLFE